MPSASISQHSPAVRGPSIGERIGSDRAADHPPRSVDEQIVEPGRVGCEHDPCLTVADVADVPAGDHQPAVGVQRDAADTSALRHDRLDGSVRPPAVDAAVVHVGEVQVVVAVDARALHQSVAARQHLDLAHRILHTGQGHPCPRPSDSRSLGPRFDRVLIATTSLASTGGIPCGSLTVSACDLRCPGRAPAGSNPGAGRSGCASTPTRAARRKPGYRSGWARR